MCREIMLQMNVIEFRICLNYPRFMQSIQKVKGKVDNVL